MFSVFGLFHEVTRSERVVAEAMNTREPANGGGWRPERGREGPLAFFAEAALKGDRAAYWTIRTADEVE